MSVPPRLQAPVRRLKTLGRRVVHHLFATCPALFRSTQRYRQWAEAAGYRSALTGPRHSASPMEPASPALARSIRFEPAQSPIVTVIIPVYGQPDHTLHCLRSIQSSGTGTPFDILVIDDCSPDDSAALLTLVEGIRLVRNEQNLGFLLSCNKAATLARGDFLLFLNNDTEVLPGWLDALHATFADIPDAGLVGSRLLFADGRLQEAGGIIWQDASGWNYGRGDDAERPEYNFLRDVDYCSGASIMVPRQLFAGLGGFDTRYAPAYYEDTDLAFAVRQSGRRVLCQPLSVVLHFEGISSGTDINTGIKACQAVNQQTFRAKWQDVLAGHGTRSGALRQHSERGVRRQALVFDWSTPRPDQDSGSIDTQNYICMLQQLGFKVVFCPHDLAHAGPYTQALQRHGVECLYAPHTASIRQHLQQRGAVYDLVLLQRVHFAAREIDRVRKYCRQARILFNTVDLHHVREARQAEVEQSQQLRKAARRTRELEFRLMRRVSATIVISEHERQLIRQAQPELRVATLPYIREVVSVTAGWSERRDIVFVGNFSFEPNVDAVRHFVEDIWPQVHAALPDARFLVAGSDMPAALRTLETAPGVSLLGYVADLSELLHCCRVTVAPLRFGAGIKGKVGTSLCHGVPCVATPLAAEGMGLTDREDIMLGTDPDSFARAVVDVYRDQALWERVSRSGRERFRQEFSFARGLERLHALLVRDLGMTL